jgi:REP element-mobilizing transposase RayT
MKRIRITYPGAFHHVMNRGYNGNDIFAGNKHKAQFLEILEGTAKKLKIHLLAYCIMDTHYHLVLENNNGRMSDFLGQVNGLYGMYYRKVEGGNGYVFQSRFKSTLIENDSYLIQSLLYLLLNPVRAGIVYCAEAYTWSSINEYFSSKSMGIVDAVFVNELFGSREQMIISLGSMVNKELEIITTVHGEILGNRNYMEIAREKHNRRERPTEQSDGVNRQDERYFEPVQKVIQEFEKMEAVPISGIDTGTYKGKRQRGELLVLLKDKAGLKYTEIAGLENFTDLSFVSLRSIYRNMKSKKKKDEV